MAVINRLRLSLNQFQLLLLLSLLLPFFATSLTFNFSSFPPDVANISMEGNAHPDGSLRLTNSALDQNLNYSTGRATYKETFLLRQNSTGKLADFTSSFTFAIQSDGRSNFPADGLAFFLAPAGSSLDSILGQGCSLGLPVNNSLENYTKSGILYFEYPFVAVEFDIFLNVDSGNRSIDLGLNYTHVGIDINSLKSNVTAPWDGGNITTGGKNNATISYNSTSKNLSVAFTTIQNEVQVIRNIDFSVDLLQYLPDKVIVGFSASTGQQFALHRIISWSFDSTSLADENITSTLPAPKSGNANVGLVVGLAVGGGVILVGVLGFVFLFCRKRRETTGESTDDDTRVLNDLDPEEFEKGKGPRKFSYNELALATNNFAQGEKFCQSDRPRKPPSYLTDYKTNHAVLLGQAVALPSTSGTRYPLQRYISYSGLSSNYRSFVNNISQLVEPANYEQASRDPQWVAAMNTEIQALEDNGTWSMVPLPLGQRPIGCKWVFKIKYHSDGTIERYKARLVAKGFNQREGIDYKDTFAPVAKLITVRCLLAIAAVRNWPLHQMDVQNAFLHGKLLEEVYMLPPPGYRRHGENSVCQLHKSLYGLKQASRSWFQRFSSSIQEIGFQQSRADYSLFTQVRDNSITVVLLYVDDMIITGNNEEAILSLKQFLNSRFKIKDLGPLKYFLGIEVARSEAGITICQRKYTLDILEEAGLLGVKPATVPMEPDLVLTTKGSDALKNPTRFRRLIGKLIYLTITRPDITFAVNTLSQFMQEPKLHHFKAALRLLHYLKSVPGQGLFFSSQNHLRLIGYCDAD